MTCTTDTFGSEKTTGTAQASIEPARPPATAAVPRRTALEDGTPLSIEVGRNDMRLIDVITAPLRVWVSPRFHGLENIPADGPALLVANHSLVALDGPLLIHEVLRRHGRLVRGITDHGLMDKPVMGKLVQRTGGVRGTREICRALLEHGEIVMVLPGGTREAFRRKHEKYVLKWEGRTGFARMAIEAGVPIIPIAMIGSNDAFDIVIDGHHALMWPLRRLGAAGPRQNPAPPLFHGLGPTLLPKPQRFYFSLGAPIDAAQWRGPDDRAPELQSVVREALEKEFAFLFAERERDRGRTLWGRTRTALRL
ncbi:lysophospholipid acyltransferase family protein [Nocardia wallacei]|uniref:lysophospholipid acyltransferase family protein n=1 Tax=Nocardia wallacei TaxID=480035 RepID=UPI002459027E|nr:lysophospholipid acyltransferase family protein [Nocardia wallacei]